MAFPGARLGQTQVLSGPRVLCLDDNKSIADELAEAFIDLGCVDAYVAYDIEGVEAILGQIHIELALLDVGLGGGISSVATGSRIAALGGKVVFMSGYSRWELTSALDDFEFVEKPVSYSTLEGIVAAYLSTSNAA
ncbi:MAG: hypothetical protein GKR98_00860 [Boseongicola sp.]|nr:MAG: hypothetical protein GKR98_00860 [Boseongicola sp.]